MCCRHTGVLVSVTEGLCCWWAFLQPHIDAAEVVLPADPCSLFSCSSFIILPQLSVCSAASSSFNLRHFLSINFFFSPHSYSHFVFSHLFPAHLLFSFVNFRFLFVTFIVALLSVSSFSVCADLYPCLLQICFYSSFFLFFPFLPFHLIPNRLSLSFHLIPSSCFHLFARCLLLLNASSLIYPAFIASMDILFLFITS